MKHYFDYCGRIASQHEHWSLSTEQAEEKFRLQQEQLEKQRLLNERQEKLKALLQTENAQYDLEMKGTRSKAISSFQNQLIFYFQTTVDLEVAKLQQTFWNPFARHS